MFKRTKVCASLMLAFGGGFVFGVDPALAQDAQRVEITGSSIRRVDAETALPVTVITRDEITRSGVLNAEQLVRTISSVSTAQSTGGASLVGLATYGLSTVSMRGLGEQRTLVLMNGRRLAVFAGSNVPFGGVDINSIPMAAIERVEVLRDGASSLYGSDAVAGVINFIMRKDYKGLEATAYYGDPTRTGGGKVSKASIVFGAGDLDSDKFNLMLIGDVERSSALFGRERDFAKSGVVLPYFFSGATPSGRIEGIWDSTKTFGQNSRDATTNPFGISTTGYGNPAADDINTGTGHTGPNNCAAIRMFQAPTKGGIGGALDNCLYDPASDVGLFPKVEHMDLMANFKFQINPNMQFYAEGLYARNKVNEVYQASPVRAAFFTTDPLFSDPAANPNNVQPALLIKPGNPAYTSILSPYLQSHGLAAMDGQTIAVTNRALILGGRAEIDTNTQTRFVAGLNGTLSNWDYDVAYTSNKSKSDGQLVDGYFSQLKLAEIINNSNWNPWGVPGEDTALTQQLQAAKYIGPTITGTSSSDAVDGHLTGTLTTLAAGPLQASLGAAARRESFKVDVPPILGGGDIAGLGGAVLPQDAKRTTNSLFGEFNIPVMKGLEANVSDRWDNYSDVGSTNNGKLSVRWTPANNVLLRSAIGTGFRAPSLVELHQGVALAATEQFIDPLFVSDGPIQPDALNGGNPNLKPEKSKQFTLGAVFSPIKEFSVALDYYYIQIEDMILKPGALGMINAARAGTPLYYAGDVTFLSDGSVAQVDQTLRNAGTATTSGVDVDIRWAQPLAGGKLSVDLAGTYVSKYDLTNAGVTQHSVGSIANADGTPLFIAINGGVVLRWKHRLTANWTTGPWSTTFAQNFNKGYGDVPDLNGDPHRTPDFATYDAQLAYTGIKNLTLTGGVRNVFDKNPPLFIGAGAYFGSGFDPTNYDARARFLYFSVNYKFF